MVSRYLQTIYAYLGKKLNMKKVHHPTKCLKTSRIGNLLQRKSIKYDALISHISFIRMIISVAIFRY